MSIPAVDPSTPETTPVVPPPVDPSTVFSPGDATKVLARSVVRLTRVYDMSGTAVAGIFSDCSDGKFTQELYLKCTECANFHMRCVSKGGMGMVLNDAHAACSDRFACTCMISGVDISQSVRCDYNTLMDRGEAEVESAFRSELQLFLAQNGRPADNGTVDGIMSRAREDYDKATPGISIMKRIQMEIQSENVVSTLVQLSASATVALEGAGTIRNVKLSQAIDQVESVIRNNTATVDVLTQLSTRVVHFVIESQTKIIENWIDLVIGPMILIGGAVVIALLALIFGVPAAIRAISTILASIVVHIRRAFSV